MDVNKEDGGERKFILITNSESNICQKVTIPRIQKAIEKFEYKEELEICCPAKV
jgi:adenine-specific DNA-methyltransferase